MSKLKFYIILLIFTSSLSAKANRAMYVDDFENILGDIAAENTLLGYAQSNNIKTLLLYGLHIVNANHDLANASSNFILADFIYKAKTSYGILAVGATAENGEFFTDVIDAYNNSRNEALEKFDIYNLEFEYWSNASSGPGGYYCSTYLTPNGIPCNVDGAFQFYISILQTMDSLAANNTHPISTEAYVGWPTTGQADTIGANLDKLRLHAYVSDPNTAYNYTANRLLDFANGNPGLPVSIIFSSEPSFMQDWLENNSMISAEDIFVTDWMNSTSGWTNNINLEDFTYFTYTDMANITLPIQLEYFKGQQIDENILLQWKTLSEVNADYFEIERQNHNTKEFNTLGIIYSEGNSSSPIQYYFLDKSPEIKTNYYRLKQIDNDGKYEYSNIIAIDYNQRNTKTLIFPSITNDIIYINSQEKIEQLIIYDSSGRKIKELHKNNQLDNFELNVDYLTPGIYILVLNFNAKLETFRFVKE